MTDVERLFWRALRQSLPQFHWRKQVPFGPHIVDFCSHSERMVIELDGGQHSGSDESARTRFLEREGYRILRFWNNEVMENLDGVIAAIAQALPPCGGGLGGGPEQRS